MNPTILNHAFQHPADGWYQIEALGNHPHRAARLVQVIDHSAVEAIVKHFNADATAGRLRHGSEMLIDHEHFSDQPDQETRAYGWLQELQQRADGVYGRIRWTSTGKAAVDGGDYRFFSTEYEPQDLALLKAESGKQESENKRVRPMRLAGLTLTNMNNNRGQKPITNRADAGVAAAGAACGRAAHNQTTTFADGQAEFWPASADINETNGDGHRPPLQNQGTTMKSVCTLLGLAAEADEIAVHAAVSRLLNRGDVSPEALASLRAEHQSLSGQNQNLLAEQSETLLDGCGVKDERVRNRLKDGMKLLKNREERVNYLADFGYEPGKNDGAHRDAATKQTRVLNRGTGPVKEPSATLGESEQSLAVKIQNRASELQGKGLKYDPAWNQAKREVMGKN